ncbi:ABC transporter substrate-binding protein [Rhodococcus pseudokoreensis]|uniref:ABC transporter substrate-binding protein n=1 Tax=Rhodococcus pseudokoreensis TaxID=2811421 RepID=A0A974W1X1_9NOCA|nr:ABC transporter substrate-binding protein [Rhodococcus pseudokoreensis]QSE89803.1 ABC transporter substrate-binding protein [Rhodococcus pseudokoreensis]
MAVKAPLPRSRGSLIVALVAALIAVLALSGCRPQSTGLTGAATGQFAIGQTSPINNLSPHPFSSSTQVWEKALFDTLVTIDPDPKPSLARTWEVAEGSRTYTFHLTPGVTFTNGTPLTAQVVVDNLLWAADPAHKVAGNAVLRPGQPIALDPNTVQIRFPAPVPQLLSTLAVVPIIDLTSDLATRPVGTGPFKVAEFVPNDHLNLVRNENYWDATRRPSMSTFNVRVYSDVSAATAALSSGQIQALAFPPFDQVTSLRKQGNRVVSTDAPGNFMIRVNTSSGPLSNQKVRQALAASINRDAFTQLTGDGTTQPNRSIYPPSSPVFAPEVGRCEHDLAHARDLLVQAGYPDGLDLTIDVSSVRQPEQTRFAQFWQQDLAEIGVRLKVKNVSGTVFSSNIIGGQYELSADWVPWGNADPALIFITATFTPGATLEKFADPEYARIVDAAQTELDPDDRLAAYQQINRYLVDQAFVIPIATRPFLYAVRPGIDSFDVDPFGMVVATSITSAA